MLLLVLYNNKNLLLLAVLYIIAMPERLSIYREPILPCPFIQVNPNKKEPAMRGS